MFDVWTLGCEESEKARDIGRGVSQGKEGQGRPRPQNTTIGERGLDVINRRGYRPVACTLYLELATNGTQRWDAPLTPPPRSGARVTSNQ